MHRFSTTHAPTTCVSTRVPNVSTRVRSVRALVASIDRPAVKVEEPPTVAEKKKPKKTSKDTSTLNVAALGTMYTIKNHVPKRAAPAGMRTLDELPVVKGLPMFGMSLENAKPTFDMYDLFEKYGENFMIDMGPGRGMMLTSRSGHDIREVMEEKGDIYQGYASAVNSKLAWGVGNNPTSTHLWRWRRAMAKVMSPEVTMRLHLPRMINEMEDFLRKNVGKGEFKLADLSKWMAISAGSRALLGNLISDEDVSYLVQLDEGDAQGDALFSFDFGLDLGIPGSSFWRGMKSRDGTAKLFAQRLDMPYEDLKAKAGPDSTLLKLLLSLEEEGLVTESTSSKELADLIAQEACLVMSVGSLSLSHHLLREVVELANKPQWLDALWKEQERLMAEYGPALSRQLLSRSAVAFACAQESLRLDPALKISYRYATEDTSMGDLVVPAGTRMALGLVASAKTTGTSGEVWNPGQWLSEDHTTAVMNDDIDHMPFGTGPQRCPGRNIATTGMIAKLALLARYVKRIDMSEVEKKRIFYLRHPTKLPVSLIARDPMPAPLEK